MVSSTLVMSGTVNRCIRVAAKQVASDLVVLGRTLAETLPARSPDPSALLRRIACPLVSVPLTPAQGSEGCSSLDKERESVCPV
jgi:hypothetical protein